MEYAEILAWFRETFVWLWSQWQVKTLLGLIGVNFATAVFIGIGTGEFRLGRLAEVLYRKILPWLGVYAVFSLAGGLLDMAWVATSAWGLLTGKLIGDLLDSLGQLGIFKEKIPAQLQR